MALSPIVSQSLSTIAIDDRGDAVRGWEWLASETERVLGERPGPADERVEFWLGRLFEQGVSAFGLHVELGLAFFASLGHPEAVKAILEKAMEDSPANARWVGPGAEHLANDALRAAAHGCTDARAVELMLQINGLGLATDLPDGLGQTPLHAACKSARPALVRALLACGSNPNATDEEGDTPLHCLAGAKVWTERLGQLKNRGVILTELVAAGADISLSNKAGQTALSALGASGWPREMMAQSLVMIPPTRSTAPGSSRRH